MLCEVLMTLGCYDFILRLRPQSERVFKLSWMVLTRVVRQGMPGRNLIDVPSMQFPSTRLAGCALRERNSSALPSLRLSEARAVG